MTRGCYSSAIFISILYTLITVFRSGIYLQLNERIMELPSFNDWYIFEFLISLAWQFILLTYFYYNQYRLTFWVTIISICASIFHLISTYSFLTTGLVPGNFFIANLLVHGIGILSGISLIFSKTGKKPWLKVAGIFISLLGLIMMSTFVWMIISRDVAQNGKAAKIEQWASLIFILVPVLFIINFWREKETAVNEPSSSKETIVSFMNLGAFVAILGMLNFGYKLTNDALLLSQNPNRVGEHLEKIAQPFEARTFVNIKGDTLRYRLMKPMNYDSTKMYPLVLSMHGSSGCGTDNVKQVAAAVTPTLLSVPENRTKFPAFIYVPQCPRKYNWGGINGQQAIDSLVLDGMFALEKEFSIDINRRYITGVSLGGYGTWHLIATRPKLFAAAIPICGEAILHLAKKWWVYQFGLFMEQKIKMFL